MVLENLTERHVSSTSKTLTRKKTLKFCGFLIKK